MSLFGSLLHLYKKSGSTTPMEDFCTEALAGVLKSEDQLVQDFAYDVLELTQDGSYYLKTQQSYFNTDGKQSIIDIVLESEKTICFLEMKVHAGEGDSQLQKYEKQLKELVQKSSKKGEIRYCTLYHDKKDNIKQIRWAHIAAFLQEYKSDNQLINEFYNFLKENKMAGNERFTYEDLIGLKVYGDIASKVNQVFNLIEGDLKENFGKVSGGITNSSQVSRHGRLAIYCTNVIGDTWSEVLVSFDFNRQTPGEGPMVAVQFFINGDNSSFNKVITVAQKFEQANFTEHPKVNGGRMRFEIPLASFLEEEHQVSAITSWIKKHIQIIADFKDANPDIGWVEKNGSE